MRLLSVLLVLGSAAAAPVTFTKTYSNAVDVLQWTEVEGQLTGTYQQVLRTDGQPPALKTTTASFTGTRNGPTVTLRFSQSLLGLTDTRIWTGTLSGNNLNLTWPLATGGLNTVNYTRSSSEAYNAAVAQLTRGVTAARAAFARQQEKEQAERAAIQAQTRAVQNADQAARDALNDAADLTRDLQAGIREVADAVKLLEADLASHREEQAELLEEAGQAETCSDVGLVQGYGLSMLSGYSLNTLTGYDSSNFTNAVSQVRTDLALAQTALGGLQAAAQAHRTVPAANPRAEARLSFQPGQVTQAQTALSAAIKAATAALTSAQARHQVILKEAQALVDQAEVITGRLTCQLDS